MRAGRPGPPVEVGVRLDGLRIEPSAALGDDGLEVGEGGEVAAYDGSLAQRAAILCRAVVRRIRPREKPCDTLRGREARPPVSARVLVYLDDAAGRRRQM